MYLWANEQVESDRLLNISKYIGGKKEENAKKKILTLWNVKNYISKIHHRILFDFIFSLKYPRWGMQSILTDLFMDSSRSFSWKQ